MRRGLPSPRVPGAPPLSSRLAFAGPLSSRLAPTWREGGGGGGRTLADIDGARAAPPGLGGSGGSAAAAAPVSTAPARASLDRSEVRAPRHSSENTGGPYGGRHQRPSYHERSAPVKYLLFGDSFVRLFGLVKHREIKLQAFKGSSAKGLTREGNENRDAIERTLAENPQAELTLTPTQRAAFCPSTHPSTHPSTNPSIPAGGAGALRLRQRRRAPLVVLVQVLQEERHRPRHHRRGLRRVRRRPAWLAEAAQDDRRRLPEPGAPQPKACNLTSCSPQPGAAACTLPTPQAAPLTLTCP